jgi:hypothetical protein
MHNSLKIIKTLLYSYSALHVSVTLAPIIRSLLILHIQTPITVCCWVGYIFRLWSVTTVAFATVVTDAQRHAVLSWYMYSRVPPSCNSCYVCAIMSIPIVVRHNKTR